MNELEGKLAVVTGGNGDIGAEIAMMLAMNGAEVVATFNKGHDRIDELSRIASEKRLQLKAKQLNVSNEDEVRSFFAKRFDSKAPHILVNVAGHSSKEIWFKKPEELVASDWTEIYSVDVVGSFNCIREAAKLMNRKNGGSIVNFSSTAGVYGHTEGFPYTAAKAALVALTKSLAYVYGPKIRVNAIAPGNIDAGSIRWYTKSEVEALEQEVPLGRLGKVEEVSNLVLFLASDRSSFITGQTVIIDGGY